MSALADRLDALGITAAELAAIVRRPVEDVEQWVKAKTLGGEAAVLVRFLADDHIATLAAERVRHAVSRDMRGDAAKLAGIEAVPPDGSGHHGTTGGQPE